MLAVTGKLAGWAFSDYLDETDGLDLANVTFVEPCGLVGIAALADKAVHEGRTVEFTTPRRQDVRNYLARMGLGEVLSGLSIEHGLPTVNVTPLPGDLLELQSFSSEHDGDSLAKLVHSKLSDDSADTQVVAALFDALIELTANVTSHAEVERGYLAAQTFRQGDAKRIVFSIADGGIGIPNSLRKNPNYAELTSDTDAVREAMNYGASSLTEAGRGSGLHDVIKATVELNGEATILSGDARLQAAVGPSSYRTYAARNPYPGTLIQVEIGYTP